MVGETLKKFSKSYRIEKAFFAATRPNGTPNLPPPPKKSTAAALPIFFTEAYGYTKAKHLYWHLLSKALLAPLP